MKRRKIDILQENQVKGNCYCCGVEALRHKAEDYCICDNCSRKDLIVCNICERTVEYTRDEFRSGRCKGLVKCDSYFWACEGECVRKHNENKEQRRRERLPTREGYIAEIEEEEEEERRQPLKGYSRRVLGIRRLRDTPFEEYYEDNVAHENRVDGAIGLKLKELDGDGFMHERPEGMTKKEWIVQKRRRRKEKKEKEWQIRRDQDMRFHNTPKALLIDNLGTVVCRCEATEIRQGKFCNSCKLLTSVNEYLMRLFKDTAEAIK